MDIDNILKGYLDEMEDSDIMEVGGFEKIKRDPNKKVRGDSKRISKEERKRIKKKRKQEKEMEKQFDDMQFV